VGFIIDHDTRAMKREMNELAARYLRVTALVLAIFYLIRCLNYYFSLADHHWPVLVLAMSLSIVCCLAVFAVARRAETSSNFINLATILIGGILLLNVYLNLYITGDSSQLIAASFGVIAFGLVTIHFWIWAIQLMLFLGTYVWAIHNITAFPSPQVLSFLLMGLLLSFVAFRTRAPIIKERLQLEIKLRDDAQKLSAANEAKDRFVANMTHELRTPLTGIMGMMDLIEETNLDEEQGLMIDNAQKSAGYLLNIVNDILDYAKLEAGKVALRLEAVNLASLARDTLGVFKAQAVQKNIELVFNGPSAEEPFVMADGVRLGQILLNLVGNAVKFTEVGSVELLIECRNTNGGALAKFTVMDTGPGIAADVQEQLFRRFEQVDDSVTRVTHGTGLGLAICKDLVELMGGRILVHSELGQGAVFTLEIPFETASASSAAPGSQPISAVELEKTVEANQYRALLAEDNEVNQTILMRLLELEGFGVTLAEDGQQAVDAVRTAKQPYDIIFMDMQMPVLGGLDATKVIRDQTAKPPPIVAVTANTMENDLVEYKAAGIVAVLGKPLDRNELRRIIAENLTPSSTTAS
jgi:signal transduction histidine kinase/CheY-like chemotaxis protein